MSMKMVSRLAVKFSAVLSLFLGLAAADYLLFTGLVRELRSVAPAVSLAGRQRYLAQKTAYACFMVYAGHNEDSAAGRAAMDEFEAVLAALEKGGDVSGIRIEPVPAAVVPSLRKQKGAWSAFRGPALAALRGSGGAGPEEFRRNLRRVEELSDETISASEDVVSGLQRVALLLVARTRAWLLAVVFANLALALFAFWLALRHIAEPVARLVRSSDGLAAGNYSPPDTEVQDDEIGGMELSFRRMAKAINRDREMREALRALFDLSLRPLSPERFLTGALEKVLGLPWLTAEPRGAVFLSERAGGALVMKAHVGLSGALAGKCATVARGYCLCGRAAASGETLYAAAVDERHECGYEGMPPHGHYCVPIRSSAGLSGVLMVYLAAGHARNEEEVVFLENAAALLGGIIEKKLAEEEQRKLAEVLRQASEAVFITETDGRLVYVNEAFEKMTGYPAAEALGRTPDLLKSGSHDERYYREMWVSMENGVPWIGRIINKRKDGSLVEVQANIFPVKDPAGRVMNYVAIQEDMSSRVELEGQLRQAQKMEAVGRLAGGVAHDFNNMLSAIGGYAHLMTGKVSGQAAADLEEIKKAAGKAAGLTKRLLAFSRKSRAVMQPLDMGELLRENKKLLARLIGERFCLEVNSVPGLEPVRADRGLVEQVLMNLVVNGADAMPAGGRIAVAAASVEIGETIAAATGKVLPGRYVTLSVRDGGSGIKMEDLPKIFDPAAKALVKKQYIFDPGRNEYIAAAPPEGKAGLELLDALSGVFLYEKNSFLADTFRDSANPNIAVYRNGKALGRGSSLDGAGYKAGDSIDLVVPAAAIRDSYAARIRVNYKGGEYQEEKILVHNQQSGSPGPARLNPASP